MEDSENDHVMSEIHLGCPPTTIGPFISRFTFSSCPLLLDPSSMIDKDGDLLLPRRRRTSKFLSLCSLLSLLFLFPYALSLLIASTTPSSLQVWKSQLVLSDFVLHNMSLLNGLVCLELGAGTGLLGILLARVAKAVFLTGAPSSHPSSQTQTIAIYISPTFSCTIDHGDQILGNCLRNVELNSSLFHPQAIVNVRDLNWMSEWPLQVTHADPKPFCWSFQDFELVKSASFIFAADVIYSDDLTIALFSMLKRLMSLGCDKVLYLGLEKRYNFSLDDLNVVANGYACFRRYIKEDALCDLSDKKSFFVGNRIDLKQIPQYTQGYDRGEDVELWEIRYLTLLLSACISEAQECVRLASARNDESANPENFAILRGLLLKLQELISQVPIPEKDEGLPSLGLLLDEEKQRTATSAGSKLGIIVDMLKLIFRENGSNHADDYRVHVQELEQNSTDVIKGKVSRTLSWWCFNPGVTMQDIAKKGVGSIILTSGTLSPMDSLAQELELEFPVRLENPHVISSNQLWAGVVSTGPSGCVLNYCYSNRDVPEYKQELGNVLLGSVDFSRVVPDGLLVFFPSYNLMDRCIAFWKDGSDSSSMTTWERICELKKLVIEPKDSYLFPAAMQDFSEKVQDKSKFPVRYFFAVCRGKVSEGLDSLTALAELLSLLGYLMPGLALRGHLVGRSCCTAFNFFAATCSGVNNPLVRQVKLKREFLDEQSGLANVKFRRSTRLSGSMWCQEAARAVNQKIGRVIRHRHDYGAIIFCDERFEQRSQQSKISVWIRPHVKVYVSAPSIFCVSWSCYSSRYGDVISDLARFFQTERSNIPPARIVTEQEHNIGNNSYVKDVGLVRNESDGNFVKWKGLTILKRKGKMPRIVKGDVMQACSSRKTR
uniref:ATP-dependent helicase C-terminal domain-containing protein n=1 Tax=Brassica campestris TaxID=3711 RepID=M4F2A5_BRACM